MHYVGMIIQRVWAEEPGGRRAGQHRHRRPKTAAGSARRRTAQVREPLG